MESLHVELLSIILSLLDDRSRRMMRLSNTLWFNRIRYNKFIVYLTRQEQVSSIIERLKKYMHPIELKFCKPRCTLTPLHYEELGQLTQLTSLDLGDARNESRQWTEPHPLSGLTNLETLENESELPLSVMRCFTKLRKIHVTAQHDNTCLDLVHFTNLEHADFRYSLNARDSFATLPCPHRLTYLHLNKLPKELPDLLQFTSLKEFLIEVDGLADIPHLPYLETMLLKADDARISPFNQKLTSLWLITNQVAGSVLQPLHNLRELDLSCFVGGDGANCPTLESLTNLRKLTLYYGNLSSAPDLEYLSALDNLEDLTLNSLPFAKESIDCALTATSAEKLTRFSVCGRRHVKKLSLELITKFGNLQTLQCQQVATFSVSGLVQLASTLTSLTLLDGPNLLSTVEALTALKQLTVHSSPCPHIDSHVLRISKLSRLEEFKFLLTTRIDTQNMQRLSNLTCLEMLVQTTELYEQMAQLQALQDLNITDYNLTDDAIELLQGAARLTCLYISHRSAWTSHSTSTWTGHTLTRLTSLQYLNVDPFKTINCFDEATFRRALPLLKWWGLQWKEYYFRRRTN